MTAPVEADNSSRTSLPRKTAGRRLPALLQSPLAAVAAIALIHGLLWSLLTPPFQGPDEPAHFAYTQYLAETGKLPPARGLPEGSSEERVALGAIGTLAIIGRPANKPPQSDAGARISEAEVNASKTLSRSDGGGPSTASTQPPLFYALAVLPYYAGSKSTILTRVWLIRLLSVVFFAATAVGVALLAGELLPSRPWAVLLGGLVVALQPMLAFASAVVNPDALLFAVSTFALLMAARVVRTGLTLRRAFWLGGLLGAGLMTKATFLGLVPGLLIAVGIGLQRVSRARGRREALKIAAAGAAAAIALPLAYVLWSTLQGRGLVPAGDGVSLLPADQQPAGSLRAMLSYTWQLYLPRPPFIQDQFGYFAPYWIWLIGLVGRLGWVDYGVSTWIYHLGSVVFIVSLVLLLVASVRARRQIWERRREVIVFVVCAVGLALEIGYAGYNYRRTTGQGFEQARYLFPVVALYASGIVVACTALGRRLAPTLAAVYVSVSSLTLLAVVFATVARYYG